MHPNTIKAADSQLEGPCGPDELCVWAAISAQMRAGKSGHLDAASEDQNQ